MSTLLSAAVLVAAAVLITICFQAGDALGFASVEIRSPAEERTAREEARTGRAAADAEALESCERALRELRQRVER